MLRMLEVESHGRFELLMRAWPDSTALVELAELRLLRRPPLPLSRRASRNSPRGGLATNVAVSYHCRVIHKQRLSASVDASLLKAAEDAVEHGRAPTLSAWVNEALRLKLEHDRRLTALADFVATYERRHGEISAEEMRVATRRARQRAVVVRETGPRAARGGR